MEKIKVISTCRGKVRLDYPQLRIVREWAKCGDAQLFTQDQLDELYYMPAFHNMVNEGTLYIEDMKEKKRLGIEPEDAVEPTIKLLDEKELNKFWKLMPFSQFKLELEKLTRAQKESLAQYAIVHGDEGSIEKANYLSDKTGYQILKGIELEKLAKEV